MGDSVLGLICADAIYSEYRALPEGDLTKLRAAIVCEGSLYEFAMRIGLGEHLLLGRGERAGGGSRRPSVLADAVEAVIAALYLDGGMEAARGFILDFIRGKAEETIRCGRAVDYKTALQEIVQKTMRRRWNTAWREERGPTMTRALSSNCLSIPTSSPPARAKAKSRPSSRGPRRAGADGRAKLR